MKTLLVRIAKDTRGFGLNELLGIAAAFILAAFIIIPGLRDFADSVMSDLNTWWASISDIIFSTE